MKKSKIVLLFIISMIGFVGGYMILNSNLEVNDTGYLLVKTGKALFYGMAALAVVFLVLIFKSTAVGTWKKFAIWYVPLATLLFIVYPQPGSGDLFSPYPEQIYMWVSMLYVLISLVLISVHFVRNRRMIK